MIVYKKAVVYQKEIFSSSSFSSYVIVKMQVDGNLVVKTSCGKMRAKSVLVLSITSRNGKKTFERAYSAGFGGARQARFITGKITNADWLNKNPLVECGHGINFFKTRKQAVNY